MKPAVTESGLHFEIDTHHCQLFPSEIDQLRADLGTLERSVERFPYSDLRVLVEYNARTSDYTVKTTLLLPGDTLVAFDHDPVMHAAYRRCLDVLEGSVAAYKDRLGSVSERKKAQKGTDREMVSPVALDDDALRSAVDAGDYTAFRTALLPYEEDLRKRVGRWIERYPALNAEIGRRLKVADLVEEVFLTAFERFSTRSRDLRLGEWLEGLIDPAVKTLSAQRDEALEDVNRARSAAEAEQGPEAVR